jgi:hypothetical protein
MLHPDLADPEADRVRAALSCLPMQLDPQRLEPIWRALAMRSARLGMAVPPFSATADTALHLRVGHRRIAPLAHGDGRFSFVLPNVPGGVRLCSRAAKPTELRPWLDDRRRLGVMVSRLVLHSMGVAHDIALDDPGLNEGWWSAERADARLWRWTDGEALLPSYRGVGVLEVTLDGTVEYPEPRPAEARAA